MKKTTFFPEKFIATQTVGPYEVKLRSQAYWEGKRDGPVYELSVWKDWRLVSETKWNSWEVARHQFNEAKQRAAILLAEAVLFNQGDHQ